MDNLLNLHDLRDAFDTLREMANDGKKACDAFEKLGGSCVVQFDTLANVHSDIQFQLRLIADMAAKELGLAVVKVNID